MMRGGGGGGTNIKQTTQLSSYYVYTSANLAMPLDNTALRHYIRNMANHTHYLPHACCASASYAAPLYRSFVQPKAARGPETRLHKVHPRIERSTHVVVLSFVYLSCLRAQQPPPVQVYIPTFQCHYGLPITYPHSLAATAGLFRVCSHWPAVLWLCKHKNALIVSSQRSEALFDVVYSPFSRLLGLVPHCMDEESLEAVMIASGRVKEMVLGEDDNQKVVTSKVLKLFPQILSQHNSPPFRFMESGVCCSNGQI